MTCPQARNEDTRANLLGVNGFLDGGQQGCIRSGSKLDQALDCLAADLRQVRHGFSSSWQLRLERVSPNHPIGRGDPSQVNRYRGHRPPGGVRSPRLPARPPSGKRGRLPRSGAGGPADRNRPGPQGPSRGPSHISQPPHHLHHFVQCRPVFIGARQKSFEGTVDQTGIEGRTVFIVETPTVWPNSRTFKPARGRRRSVSTIGSILTYDSQVCPGRRATPRPCGRAVVDRVCSPDNPPP